VTIEEGLFAYLAARPEITAVIGSSPTRFYPVVAPQNPTAPFVAYQRANASRDRAGSGPTRGVEAVYNLTCWAETYPAAAALARLLRNELDGIRGWWATSNWARCRRTTRATISTATCSSTGGWSCSPCNTGRLR